MKKNTFQHYRPIKGSLYFDTGIYLSIFVDLYKTLQEDFFIMKKFFILLFALFTFSAAPSFAAHSPNDYLHTKKRSAKSYYNKARTATNYFHKEALLKTALKKDPCFVEAYWMLSALYQRQNELDKAGNILLVGLTHKDLPLANPTRLKYARIEYDRGVFENTLKALNSMVPPIESTITEDILALRSDATVADSLVNHPLPYAPIPLDNINTLYEDYYPSMTADGQMFCTTVEDPSRHYTAGEDIFYSYWKKDHWSPSQAYGYPINTPENEGSQSFSLDGRYLFFVRCSDPRSYGSCDIFYAIKQGEGWSKLMHFAQPLNSIYWESTPCMSPTGDKLYFVSSRPGGLGESDIWVVDIHINRDGTLKPSNARNLGAPINTPAYELAPFMHADNHTLYFSSKGHQGVGGMDLYVARLDSMGRCLSVENMGVPLNTPGDEMGYTMNAKGDVAYYASKRLGLGKGDFQIYKVEVPKDLRPTPMSYLHGLVFDAQDSTPIATTVELFEQKGQKVYSNSMSDRKSGQFTVYLPDTGTYGLSVMHKDYLYYSAKIEQNTKNVMIPLQKIKENTAITLNNLFFATNQATILKTSEGELDRLVRFLQEEKQWQFTIEGHTDNVGTKASNIKLSKARATTMKAILVSRGIDPARITIEGYGSSRPLMSNDTEEGRAINRRVEIRLTTKEK